jgi:hypothetical protein
VYLTGAELSAGPIYKLIPVNTTLDAAGYNKIKVADASGNPLKYSFAGTNVKNAAPTIQAVVPVDALNFDIVFSEAVTKTSAEAASFTVTQGATTLTGFSTALAADGKTLHVRLVAPTKLEAGKVYTVTTTSTINDLALKPMDLGTTGSVTKQFAGTNAPNALPTVAGVTIDDARQVITVTFSEALSNATVTDTDFTITAVGYIADPTDTYEVDGNKVTITLANALGANQIATVAPKATLLDINGQGAKTDAYRFGIK